MPILIVTKNMTGHHPRHSCGNDEYSVVQVMLIITYLAIIVKKYYESYNSPKMKS